MKITDAQLRRAMQEMARRANENGAAGKGGRARAASMTPERRAEIASAAARARWKKEPRLCGETGLPDRPESC